MDGEGKADATIWVNESGESHGATLIVLDLESYFPESSIPYGGRADVPKSKQLITEGRHTVPPPATCEPHVMSYQDYHMYYPARVERRDFVPGLPHVLQVNRETMIAP